MCVDCVQAGKNHRLNFFKSRKRLNRRPVIIRDRVADLRIRDVLDIRDDESDFACDQFLDLYRLRRERAERFHLKNPSIRPQPNLLPLAQPALEYTSQNHNPSIRIEPRIKEQRLKMPLGRPLRRRNSLHNRFENIRHALPGFRADQQRIGRIQPHRALNHLPGARHIGALQVDLVDYRNNFEAVIDRQVRVRQRLRFDALRCVHHEEGAFAGGQRS